MGISFDGHTNTEWGTVMGSRSFFQHGTMEPTKGSLFNSFLHQISKAIYPNTCHNCHVETPEEDKGLCQNCRYKLKLILNPCKICGEELKDIGISESICGRCQTTPRYFDKVFAPFSYSDPLDKLIHEMKFSNKVSNCNLLAELLYEQIILQRVVLPECLIPTPFNPEQYRKRGFNQSAEIAKRLGKLLNIPVKSNIITKIENTERQAKLSYNLRQNNLKGAFILNSNVDYKHIAIIDDVVTTGATANEVSKIAKQDGVEHIQVWACARSIKL